jgi:hypothetical protein
MQNYHCLIPIFLAEAENIVVVEDGFHKNGSEMDGSSQILIPVTVSKNMNSH